MSACPPSAYGSFQHHTVKKPRGIPRGRQGVGGLRAGAGGDVVGELLAAVNREPIEIDKKGRPVAVMLSHDTYQEMKEALGEAKKTSDLSWLSKWRETATLAPAASADDEAAYQNHLDQKYGR